MYTKAAVLALAGAAAAQQSLCSKYTTALLMEDTPANQKTVLTLVVNTAVIGNYSNMSKSAVPGILSPNATYMGQSVNLAQYFDGSMATTNENNMPTAVNWLDGGAAAPLMMNMPANDTTSRQYMLLTHLYSYFGLLLGCTGVGMNGFPAYGGSGSQYEVHKFMNISEPEFMYFVSQVGASAASFGVTEDDVTTVATALTSTFGMKYSPPAAVDPSQGNQTQAICVGEGCPTATMPDIAAYSDMPTASASGAVPASTTGAASMLSVSIGSMIGSLAAAFALL